MFRGELDTEIVQDWKVVGMLDYDEHKITRNEGVGDFHSTALLMLPEDRETRGTI